MNDIIIPEATLIDIKRISKSYQSKFSRKLNYSKLFDLKESYREPKNFFEFSCDRVYPYTLTSNMDISETTKSKVFLCACSKNYDRFRLSCDFSGINNNTMVINIRPVFKYSDIKESCEVVEELAPGYLLVTFGMYPNSYDKSITARYNHTSPLVESLKSTKTGNTFTLVGTNGNEVKTTEYPEVVFDGLDGTYVIKEHSEIAFDDLDGIFAIKEKKDCKNKIYKVEPVYFLVDVKKDFAISRDVLFCLPTLKDARNVESYKETLPYEFLNNYFVPELMQDIIRQKEETAIESEEIPQIKELIDNIILASESTVLSPIVNAELQALINEFNTHIDNEKEETNNAIELSLTPISTDEIFIKRFNELFSKITNFPYYRDSKVIFASLNLNQESNSEIDSELYKDLTTIFKYILPTLPEDTSLSYQNKIKEILKNAADLIIEIYKTNKREEINIELIIRKELEPILESLYSDVTKNYIAINLNEIINGIFKSSKDKYLAYLFELINEEVKGIEILITITSKEEYTNELKQILNLNVANISFSYLMKMYLKLLKLKGELEQLDIKRTNLERKKIKRRIV